jgi:hypothetical protein
MATTDGREPLPAARPPFGGVAVAVAGVAGFVAGSGLCLALCYGLLYLYASGLPQRAEVSDSISEVPVFYGGALLSVQLSLLAGFASGWLAAARVRNLQNIGRT